MYIFIDIDINIELYVGPALEFFATVR